MANCWSIIYLQYFCYMSKIRINKNVIVIHKRMLWADVVRIIAIYLVVQIHTSSDAFSSSFFSHGPGIILSKLGVVSVPLFVMLSGALLLGKQESYKTFFSKRCIKVLIPWIIWTFVYMYFNFSFRFHDQVVSEFFSNNQAQWGHYFLRTFLRYRALSFTA